MKKIPTDRQLKQMIKQAGGLVEAAPKPPKQTDQQKLSRNLTQPGTNKAPEAQAVHRRTLEKLVDSLEQRLDNLVLNHVPGMATFTELLQSSLLKASTNDGLLQFSDVKRVHKDGDLEMARKLVVLELNYYLNAYRNLDLKAKVS